MTTPTTKSDKIRAALFSMNSALLLIGVAFVAVAFGTTADLALMQHHALFDTGVNSINAGVLSSLLLYFTRAPQQTVKIKDKK